MGKIQFKFERVVLKDCRFLYDSESNCTTKSKNLFRDQHPSYPRMSELQAYKT